MWRVLESRNIHDENRVGGFVVTTNWGEVASSTLAKGFSRITYNDEVPFHAAAF
jgi:hypothetical protein